MNLTRRAALRGGTASLVAIAADGATAAGAADRDAVADPLPDLVQEWFSHRDYIDGDLTEIALLMPPSESNQTIDAACERLRLMNDAITQTPARTAAGAAAKMRLFVEQANMWERPDWWGDDPKDDLALSVLRDLEHLAGEG